MGRGAGEAPGESGASKLPGAGASPLATRAQQQWELVKQAIGGVAEGIVDGSADGESVVAGLREVRQIGKDLDTHELLNALHLPADAGEYAAELEELLRRIPDGWGRWLSFEKGWYPLVVSLHRQLKELVPGYELHQAKEKFGRLRFYVGGEPHPYLAIEPRPEYPGREASDEQKEAGREELRRWHERQKAWEEGPGPS